VILTFFTTAQLIAFLLFDWYNICNLSTHGEYSHCSNPISGTFAYRKTCSILAGNVSSVRW